MATASLLKASSFVHRDSRPPLPLPLQWRNPLLRTTTAQIPLPSIKKRTTSTGFIKCSSSSSSSSSSRGPSAFSVQCVMNSKKCFMEEVEEEDDRERKRNQNLFEGFAEEMLKALQKSVVAAILLGVLLFAYDPYSALAASGGRMGGRAFSSHSSSSSSSSSSRSSSSSSPSRSSSSSSSSPSRSYSSSSSSSSSPSFSFYSSSSSSPSPSYYSSSVAGPSFSTVFLLFAGFSAFILVAGFLSDRSALTDTQKTTVIKLQVGLLGMARSLQKDLNRIAETADTSTSLGLSYVLQETTLALLRHPDCCISSYSSVDVKQSIDDGEKCFDKLSIEERGKFDEETLVNVNNIKRQSTTSKRANGFSNEYIVITILVAAKGMHKLPAITSSADLKEALQQLGSISSHKTMAVEVLWTPQNENDTLTERELLEDYPLLRPL